MPCPRPQPHVPALCTMLMVMGTQVMGLQAMSSWGDSILAIGHAKPCPPQARGSVGDAPNQSQLRLAGPAADPGRLVVDRDARAELGRLSNVTAIRLGINLDPSFE